MAMGHQVTILTTLRRGEPNISEKNGIKIYRAGYNTFQDLLYDLMNTRNRRNETHAASSAGSGLFSTLVQKLVDKTWRKNYWPDGSKLFLKPGLRAGEKILKDEAIDKIISVGLPFTCHLIARQLKERRASIHWHMDIQDPFSYSHEFWVNNFDKYEAKNLEEEALAFRLADSISVTNSNAMERYADIFPAQCHKLTVIPPLFHLDVAQHYEMYLAKNLTHLTYCGSFYSGVRSIEPFLKFLEKLKKHRPDLAAVIQFHLVGQMDRETNSLLSKYHEVRRLIVVHGFKNRAETFSCLEQTDLILNFGNTTDYHLPSKVVDFLYVSKPLINFITTENDSTRKFLEDKNIEVLHINLSKEITDQALEKFLEFTCAQRTVHTAATRAVADYTTEVIAEKYLA